MLPHASGGVWNAPLPVIVEGLLIAMIAAHEVGLRIHGLLSARADGRRSGSSDEGFILSGVLGLLALLMAFAFSLSLNRYEDRRQLMLAEANALGTFSMAIESVQAPSRSALLDALKPYAIERMRWSNLPDGDARRSAQTSAVSLRTAVEGRVRAALRSPIPAPTGVALANAYDALEEAAVSRDALASAHLPERVLDLLAIFCIVSGAMLGYAIASEKSRHRLASATLFLLLSLSFGTILDLDRPRAGAITIPQDALDDAVRSVVRLR